MTPSYPKELAAYSFFRDLSELLEILRLGVREAYQNALSTYEGETFYVFGIDIPSDLGAFYLGGNTEQNYFQIMARQKWYWRQKRYHRWCWHEWGAYEVLEPQPIMKQTWSWINDRPGYSDIQDGALRQQFFDHQEKCMLACAETVLREFDQDGLFGTGAERHNILLYASVNGYEKKAFTQSVKKLNPPKSLNTLRVSL